MKADLHVHSKFSFDSTETVDTLLTMSQEKGIDVIAVCDHNEIQGSLIAQKSIDPQVISGIEIDCTFGEKIVHILGYGCNLKTPYFETFWQRYAKELERIGGRRIELIEDHYGITLDRVEIERMAGDHPFTNVEISQWMLQNCDHPEFEPYRTGSRSENPIANHYWDTMSVGKWGFVALDLPDAQSVIHDIHQHGGAAIIAHPSITIGLDRTACDKLVDYGADGFEVFCSYHQEKEAAFFKAYCEEKKLLITMGSDFHGRTKPNIQMGQTGYDKECKNYIQRLLQKIDSYKI